MGWTGCWTSKAIRQRTRAVLVCALLAACGSSENGAQTTTYDDRKCITTLPRHCCDLDTRKGAVCLPEWDTATLCNAWPAGTPLLIYKAPCHGLNAIRIKTATYSSFYVYSAQTSALVAVGDNSAENEGSTSIACGAGPADFLIPSECGPIWLAADAAEACDSTTGIKPAKRDWCRDVYYPDGGE